MSAPTVSIIVLNFNGKDFLEACVAALEAQTCQDFELILVDNGSSDGSWELMQAWEGRHRLVRLETNLGFAEGNNVGMRLARGRYLVALNNDTEVDPGWLAALVETAERAPEYAMLASQIRSYAEPEILDTCGVILYPDGMSRGLGRNEPAERYGAGREVFAPSGCAGFYRRDLIEHVGMFEADFFAYCEDTDLGFRARLAGYRCWYVPEAKVLHHWSKTAGKYSPFKAYLVERNHLYLRLRVLPKRMLLASPLYTFWRYALQAWGVVTGRGASGQFVKQGPATQLVSILLKAYRDALLHLPALLRQRRAIMRQRTVPTSEILGWFRRFPITARDLAFKE